MPIDQERGGAHFKPKDAPEPVVEDVTAEAVEGADAAQGAEGAQGAEDAQEARSPWWRGVVEFLVAFLVMIGVILLLRTFVMEPFEIPSGSMLTTIEIGDRVFAEKVTVAIDRMPEPGEIVTFVNPRDDSETLIKRVIAVEGQTIDLRDGAVYVDGVQLDEPYTNHQSTKPMRCDGKVQTSDIVYPFTIPDGCFWAMGDNRGNSADSRVFGPVDASSVTGHAVFRYWPIFRVESQKPGTEVLGFEFHPIRFTIGPLS